ncbi:nitroreductase family protein [Micromonospora chaiyaphumensis]|uniref:Nitroreductase n=1 Tax=Micromonospora chaiyaphumensis TaxID=307119 RepID=A0A1C4W1M4_9ACTN|nr:nitroreductase family protein [Micromonospora chaiyaphumensis]SCE90035.1 Nitroreductase [Micromonospora chaiyaphumensis]
MTVNALPPDELLTTTRTVRRRLVLDRPVPLHLVTECLEVALQAPNGGNRQPWHWVVVTDAGLRAAVGEIYRKAWRNYRREAGPVRTAADRRLWDGGDHLAENLARVPVLVLACVSPSGGRLPDGNQASLWGSVLPAAWSYQLAARARGLGTAWTTVHLRHEQEVADLLGLPATVRQGVLLPTAYVEGTFRPAARRPLHRVLHVNGWQGPRDEQREVA